MLNTLCHSLKGTKMDHSFKSVAFQNAKSKLQMKCDINFSVQRFALMLDLSHLILQLNTNKPSQSKYIL